MRKDEYGNECPETLGEYYDICKAFLGEDSGPCKFLKVKIDTQGRDEIVIADDSQMRALLFSMVEPR